MNTVKEFMNTKLGLLIVALFATGVAVSCSPEKDIQEAGLENFNGTLSLRTGNDILSNMENATGISQGNGQVQNAINLVFGLLPMNGSVDAVSPPLLLAINAANQPFCFEAANNNSAIYSSVNIQNGNLTQLDNPDRVRQLVRSLTAAIWGRYPTNEEQDAFANFLASIRTDFSAGNGNTTNLRNAVSVLCTLIAYMPDAYTSS